MYCFLFKSKLHIGSSITTIRDGSLGSFSVLATKKAKANVRLSPSLNVVENDGGPPSKATFFPRMDIAHIPYAERLP